MTITETKECKDILQAFIDGKKVEWRARGTNNDWTRAETPSWNFRDIEYRIKPELRPYNHPKEFIEAMKEHGPFLCRKLGYFDTPVRVVPEGVVLLDHYKYFSEKATTEIFFWHDLLKYCWQDGSPCGVIEN